MGRGIRFTKHGMWCRVLCFLWIISLFTASCHAFSLTDSDSHTVSFKKPFSRIISLYTAHTENLHALGLTNEVIAVSRGTRLYPGIPRLSFRDDPERFLALKPDLVLIRPMLSRSHPQMVKRLEDSGVRVVSLQPVSIDGMFQYWKQLGLLTGLEKQAVEMIRDFQSRITAIRKRVSGIPASLRPKVYFESIHSKMKTFAPGSMAVFCLETAGGINIAADAQRVRNTNIAFYGRERILSKADEIDVYLAQKGRMNPVTIDEIISTPGFEVIRAVRDGQVYLIEEGVVSRPVPGLVNGIEKIHSLLYGRSGEVHAR